MHIYCNTQTLLAECVLTASSALSCAGLALCIANPLKILQKVFTHLNKFQFGKCIRECARRRQANSRSLPGCETIWYRNYNTPTQNHYNWDCICCVYPDYRVEYKLQRFKTRAIVWMPSPQTHFFQVFFFSHNLFGWLCIREEDYAREFPLPLAGFVLGQPYTMCLCDCCSPTVMMAVRLELGINDTQLLWPKQTKRRFCSIIKCGLCSESFAEQ